MDEVLKFPKNFIFFKFVDQMAENWILSLKQDYKSAKLLNCVFSVGRWSFRCILEYLRRYPDKTEISSSTINKETNEEILL